MTTKNPHSLENFVERHRADFDVHEPRPDLWDALAQELDGNVLQKPVAPLMTVVTDTKNEAIAPPALPKTERRNWVQRYGIAAALAVLVFAAGASEVWKTRHPAADLATVQPMASQEMTTTDDAALYLGDEPQAMNSGARGDSNSIRLTSAVRGMEAYYTSQLTSRQVELSQLAGPGAAGMAADWQHELAALDSSYRHLKRELLSHPQPEVVLTAMNRNLQIRLDILDQQLHLGAPHTVEQSNGAYVLADSRRQAE